MLPVRLTMLAVVVTGIGLGAYYNDFLQPPPQPRAITKLEIEISGGFAYIPSPNDKTIYVAYLNNVLEKENTDNNPSTPDEVVCDVPQVGTELMVVRGVVDLYQGSQPMPPTRIFNLDGAKVTFPRLNGNLPSAPRRPWKPYPLKAPRGDPAWKDLQYVPRIADHAGLTNRKIVNGWRDHKYVNGFLTLRGGTFEGTTPSDPIAELAAFEFKVNGVLEETVSGSDKTIYKVDVPDDNVDIRFSGSKLGYRRLVLKPNPRTGGPVRLRLRGLHAMSSPPNDGDELRDFCAFHTLLDPKVESKDYLRIYYKAPPLPVGGDGMPSPGYFCDGNWF